MIRDVGIIGAGAMGSGIAVCLQRAGYSVHVRDIDPAREALARARGQAVHADAASIGAACDALFVVVVDAAQIRQVLEDPRGLRGVLGARHLVIVCSTIAPDDAGTIAAAIAASGAAALDAPISGGPARAEQGTLSVMVAGAAAARERAEPLLRAVAARVFVLGERAGDGARAKLANNLLAGIHLAAAAEAVALAERLGLDARQFAELVHASSGQSWMFDDRIPRALDGDFEPRAQLAVLLKDLTLAQRAARDAGAALPLGDVAREQFAQACDSGRAALDDAALLLHYRER